MTAPNEPPVDDTHPSDVPNWLEGAYGSGNETVLEQDKQTREWVRRQFPKDPHEPVA